MKIKRLAIISLVAILLAMPAAVRGEGAPPGLSGGPLEASNASFVGENAGDYAGWSVAGVGDVNGDGYDDLLVGARNYNSFTGRAYLFLGGPGGWQLDQGLNNADAIYTGEGASNYAGRSLAGAGDVNGDGYDDMLIGAPSAGGGSRGRAYLVLGSSSPSSTSLANADAIYAGENSGDNAGYSVAGAGDVNGDGYADMLIGVPDYDSERGQASLVLGSSSPSDTPLTNADAIYTGRNTGDQAGWSVAGAGDVNGDGYTDMLIGANYYNGEQGEAYLVLGSGSPSDSSLLNADAIYTGENTGDQAGRSVAGAGDVNGDGYADLLIGALGYGSGQGRVYLVLGSGSPSDISLADADAFYTGKTLDFAGDSVAGAGDVNSDGYADVLVGAFGFGSDRTGSAYLVLGASTPYSGTLRSADAIYTTEASNGQAGGNLAGAGDVNGDGYADLLIGAWGYDSDRGKTYLLFSDYASATAARYRAIQTDAHAPVAVGASGVTTDYASGAESGSIYVTRHYRNTCGTDFATNGLLWTVDSQRGSNAQVFLTFKYNDTQIAGMNEADLKLWYRERPCQDWVQDTGATLDATRNRIGSSTTHDPHREYTIAPDQPNPTRLSLAAFSTSRPSAESLWQVLLAALLTVVLIGGRIYLWRKENHR